MTEFFADLHIHSRLSRATSKSLTLPLLAAWAQVKGLSVIGTGDFTHPVWLQETGEQLRYDEETALYVLKESPKGGLVSPILTSPPAPVFFMLQGEISSVYKCDGKTRKVHNLVFMPHYKAAQIFCKRLAKVGNLSADGRPVLGLDCRNLLEMVLETDPRAFLIPAHIWTPWYSLFGSKSGFDSVEECFGDLSDHIFALETGLSSDPAMNRLVSSLDKYRLISNSDAHSAEKLGREANRFGGRIHYDGILSALRSPQKDAPTRFLGTVEYYSEEGKYYADGHRKCHVCWLPEETRSHAGKCPVCEKNVTVGVLNRVMELADREVPFFSDETSFQPLVPLAEILAEIFGQGVKTRKVHDAYVNAIKRFGTEMSILLHAETADLNRFLNPLGEAVARVRKGAVNVQKGYDGEYGVVHIFTDKERRTINREVGEAARPQQKQAQGLSLLGETVMLGKKAKKKKSSKVLDEQATGAFTGACGEGCVAEGVAESLGVPAEAFRPIKNSVSATSSAEPACATQRACDASLAEADVAKDHQSKPPINGSAEDATRVSQEDLSRSAHSGMAGPLEGETGEAKESKDIGQGGGSLGDSINTDANTIKDAGHISSTAEARAIGSSSEVGPTGGESIEASASGPARKVKGIATMIERSGNESEGSLSAGTAARGSEGSGEVAEAVGEGKADDSSTFLFSSLHEDTTSETLPFLPLVEEEPVAVFPDELLNLEQRTAALVDTQPTLLMAGAGTGKSYTLFARLCHLLRQGTVPRSLLVVTFTRKAATGMDKQLLELFGEGAKLPVIDTLYALALDLWHKTHADVPVLLSDESARQVFSEANIEEEPAKTKLAWEAISLSRLLLRPVADEYTAFASRYTAHKSAWNLADYTDLLEFWLEQARSGIFKPLWDYVLVDEVQELSPLGRALIGAIVPASGRGFFGVGDSDQRLYQVPGDDDDVSVAFQRQWPDLQILSLMTGFRSHKGLWEVARSILEGRDGGAHAPSQGHCAVAPQGMDSVGDKAATPDFGNEAHGGATFTNTMPQSASTSHEAQAEQEKTGEGAPVTGKRQANVVSVQQKQASVHVFKSPTDEAEVQWITDKIAVLLGGITSTPDYDPKAADVFLPTRVYKPGEIAVLVRSKDLGHDIRRSLSLIGIGVSEPQSDVFWADSRVRIILQLGCRMLGISLMEHEGNDIPDCPDKVLAKGPLAMSAFLSTIQPFDVLFWHSKAFRELVRVYDQSGGWAGLVTWLHLQNDLELVRPQSPKVQILTLHAAKGLEFPVVFLPSLEEGIIPSAGPLLSGRLEKNVDVEGERRLLYTGAVRAREALFMSYAAKRRLRGANVRLKASRFLDNLPESLVTVSTLVSKKQLQEEQLHLF